MSETTPDLFDGPQLMIDIETIGLKPGCVIASIGAVYFDGDGVGRTFYRSVDIETCADAGLAIDAETLKWWLDQPDVVQEQLAGGEPLTSVLAALTQFCTPTNSASGPPTAYWANSPKFDMAILEAAYDAVDVGDTPWAFYELRDYRTLSTHPLAELTSTDGQEHHALDDAKSQAADVVATYRAINEAADE